MEERRRWRAIARGCILSLACCAAHGQTSRKVIVIGFVGGFVKRDDAKHAEVQFAAKLRARYPSEMHVEIFQNRARPAALRSILQQLDTNRDGNLSKNEKAQARIIIFGHSWGGSETVTLARDLEQQHVPVLLTIEVDAITKPGEETMTIPPNVANAVNFYQANGLLHGRSEIRASVPSKTHIIGNFLMTYKDHPVDCSAFPWYARLFTKPHIEIENDPRVWDQAALLIEAHLP